MMEHYRLMIGLKCGQSQLVPIRALFRDEDGNPVLHCSKCDPACIGNTHEHCCFIRDAQIVETGKTTRLP